ncbi:hypothetical protein ACSSS7_007699 [Eimeria intestinalis]
MNHEAYCLSIGKFAEGLYNSKNAQEVVGFVLPAAAIIGGQRRQDANTLTVDDAIYASPVLLLPWATNPAAQQRSARRRRRRAPPFFRYADTTGDLPGAETPRAAAVNDVQQRRWPMGQLLNAATLQTQSPWTPKDGAILGVTHIDLRNLGCLAVEVPLGSLKANAPFFGVPGVCFPAILGVDLLYKNDLAAPAASRPRPLPHRAALGKSCPQHPTEISGGFVEARNCANTPVNLNADCPLAKTSLFHPAYVQALRLVPAPLTQQLPPETATCAKLEGGCVPLFPSPNSCPHAEELVQLRRLLPEFRDRFDGGSEPLSPSNLLTARRDTADAAPIPTSPGRLYSAMRQVVHSRSMSVQASVRSHDVRWAEETDVAWRPLCQSPRTKPPVGTRITKGVFIWTSRGRARASARSFCSPTTMELPFELLHPSGAQMKHLDCLSLAPLAPDLAEPPLALVDLPNRMVRHVLATLQLSPFPSLWVAAPSISFLTSAKAAHHVSRLVRHRLERLCLTPHAIPSKTNSTHADHDADAEQFTRGGRNIPFPPAVGQSSVHQAQQKDPALQELGRLLNLPRSQTPPQVQSTPLRFCLVHDPLCVVIDDTAPRVVLLTLFRRCARHPHHLSYCGGHFKVTKTSAHLACRYWRPRGRHHVRVYHGTCTLCLAQSGSPGKCKCLNLPIGRPFELIAIDLFGALPLTQQQHYHILVIIDHHTGWVDLVPLHDPTAVITAHAIFDPWISLWGRAACPPLQQGPAIYVHPAQMPLRQLAHFKDLRSPSQAARRL